jgi:hypothetical protein
MAEEKKAGWDVEATRQNYGRYQSSGRGAAEHGAPLEAGDADVEGNEDARESPVGEGDGSAAGKAS